MSLGQAVTSVLLVKQPQLMKHVLGSMLLYEQMLARSPERLLWSISRALQALVYTSAGSSGTPQGDQVLAHQRLQSQSPGIELKRDQGIE